MCEKEHIKEKPMSIIQTYNTMIERIKQIVSHERITRLRTMAWLQSGLLHSRCVHLNRIASKLPGQAKKLSMVRKLERFVANRHVRVREWYHPVATGLLQEAARAGRPLRLLIDGSKVGHGHQLLMVSLGYRRRALPLAWTWIRCQRGHSSGHKQCALLAYVHTLVPKGAEVVVIGDSEFSPLQAALEGWGWFYALRQKGSHLFRRNPDQAWQRCDTMLTQPGQRGWLTNIELTQQAARPCHLLALWQIAEKVPWLIATNLPTARLTRLHYSRRMWTEGMFADFKGNGFDLEASRLQHFLHLSRLTLAVALLYVTLLAFGSQTIKNGWRPLVDRHERRDLSIFRIGFDMLERLLTNSLSFSIRPLPFFT
jgi:predicted RNA binding protein YcfA (HicA-like mRNA interferase family)